MGASVLEVDGNALQGAVILSDAGFGIKPLFPLSWIYNLSSTLVFSIFLSLIFVFILVLVFFCFSAKNSHYFIFINHTFLVCFLKLGRERDKNVWQV